MTNMKAYMIFLTGAEVQCS